MKTPLCLTLAALIWAAFNLSAVTLYVSLESTNPVVPFATWATAATNIQDAVNAAAAGDEVVVNDGMYFGHIQVPYLKPLNLRSVNGSQVTIINGGGTNRCVFLTFGASLTGFTLTNGVSFFDGGGVYGLSTNSYLTNCTLNGNSAFTGGGVSGCTLYNCTLNRNTAGRLGGAAIFTTLYNCTLNGNSAGRNFATGYGGGAEGSTLYDCTLTTNSASGNGGAAHICILYNCTLISNSAGYTSGYGGGAAGCMLYNCILRGNSAASSGGGASVDGFGNPGDTGTPSVLFNCLLVGNSARFGGAVAASLFSQCRLYNCTLSGNSALSSGGGAYGGTLYNCILQFNTATNGVNYTGTKQVTTLLNYCCTTPLPTNGVGNIDAGPLFVDYASGNLRLQPDSPCINAGNNAYATNSVIDLDGNPRISDGIVDMGAYELAFTPSVEVAQLILLVNNSDLGAKNKQPLLATLSAAMASFERGNVDSGANQLRAFQNKVRAQVARIDAVLADELINATQQIMEEGTNR